MSALHTLRSLRTLLLDPDEFFAKPGRLSPLPAAGAVLAVAILTTVGVALIGWLFTRTVDATRTVTVTEPWPDHACQGFPEDRMPRPCTIDEPETREVDVGRELWDAFVGRLPLVFVGVFVGWFVVAAMLHGASWLFDGEGSFGRTLAVAGWGMVPSVLGTAVGLAAVAVAVSGTDFSSDPEVLLRQLERLTEGGRGPVDVLAILGTTLWQAYIWTFGLQHARRLDVEPAATAAGLVALLTLLGDLLG